MEYNVKFPGLGFDFTVDPVIFTAGPVTVRWYGLLIAIGFSLAILYGLKSAPRFGVDKDKLFDCIIVGAVCAIVGARLYYVAFSFDEYKDDLVKIFYINEGGLAIYGAIIGGLLGGGITAKIKKLRLPAVFDLAALGYLIGQAIGRWGNFTNQEAFGSATELPWRMVSEATGNIPVHPCFLYESLWCALGFIVLHTLSKRKSRYDGQIFLLYIVWYGAERAIVEGLRTDSLYFFGTGLRTSQLLSLLILTIGLAALIYNAVINRRKIIQLNPAEESGADNNKEDLSNGDNN